MFLVGLFAHSRTNPVNGSTWHYGKNGVVVLNDKPTKEADGIGKIFLSAGQRTASAAFSVDVTRTVPAGLSLSSLTAASSALPDETTAAQHAALLQQLQSQSGKGFDISYIQGQIVGHQQLLNIQQAFLNAILTGNDDEHIAVLARVVIQMHLTMLQDLQTEITA